MTPKEEDIILWNDLKKDNRIALNTLFFKYYNPLLNFAKTYIAENDAEEVISDIFFDLWVKRKTLNIEVSLKIYLYKMTANRCINVIRRDRKRKDLIVGEEQGAEVDLYTSLQPDAFLILSQTKQQLKELVDQLPLKCKTVFLLSRNDMLSHKEISDILNISINTVNTQLYRALKFLRTNYKSYLLFF